MSQTIDSVQGESQIRPLVHIGLHKTASSWFQTCFYPHVRNRRTVDRVDVRRLLLGGTGYSFDATATREALGLERPLILCDEDLSGILHNGGIVTTYLARATAERIHAVAPDAEIILFVRAQVPMAAACYHQYVREGGTASVRRYLFPENYRHLTKQRPFKTPRFDFAQFDYPGLIRCYDVLFGPARVHIFAYEAFARDPKGFLDKFAAYFGLDVRMGEIQRPRVNSSYRWGTLAIARILNLFTARSVADKRVIIHIPYWYPIRKKLLQMLDRLPLLGPRPNPEALLGDTVSAWIRGHFADANQHLAERMQVDLQALGYALDALPAPRPTRPAFLKALRN